MTLNKLRYSVALLALAAAISCGWIKTGPLPLESERADLEGQASYTPASVRLNGEYQGTTANLAPLRRLIKDLMTARTANGVFRESSARIENRVFVEVDPRMSVGVLADLVLAINENGGEACFILPGAKLGHEGLNVSRPYPFTLVLEAGVKHDYSNAPLYRLYEPENEAHTATPWFEVSDDSNTLVPARASLGSIEISADGNYFVNERADMSDARSPDDVVIVQHPVPVSEIRSHGLRLYSASGEQARLTIVASEFASAESLLRLFEIFENDMTQWQVVVRKKKGGH